jgi:hypothetical protein
LPDFVPARSIACSMVSVVNTPKTTGIPFSRPTTAIPLETSALIYSKCGVAPRIIAPRQMTASNRPLLASFFAVSGSQKSRELYK